MPQEKPQKKYVDPENKGLNRIDPDNKGLNGIDLENKGFTATAFIICKPKARLNPIKLLLNLSMLILKTKDLAKLILKTKNLAKLILIIRDLSPHLENGKRPI